MQEDSLAFELTAVVVGSVGIAVLVEQPVVAVLHTDRMLLDRMRHVGVVAESLVVADEHWHNDRSVCFEANSLMSCDHKKTSLAA